MHMLVTCAPYLVTEQQWLGVELFAALMAGQFGGVTVPTLCWFQGLTRGCFGLGLPWDRRGGHGWVGRHQWGH